MNRRAGDAAARQGLRRRVSRLVGIDIPPALRRAVWPVLAAAVVAVLLVGVFPVRTYLHQRSTLARASAQLEVLREHNAELDRRAEVLRSDAEVERLARERYNRVRPGEEAYAMLPPPGEPTTTTTAPATGPADGGDDRNPVERVWDAVTGLF